MKDEVKEYYELYALGDLKNYVSIGEFKSTRKASNYAISMRGKFPTIYANLEMKIFKVTETKHYEEVK